MRTKLSLATSRVPSMLGFADTLLRSEGAGLIALDADFRLIFWNGAMEAIAGLAADAVMGRSAVEVFPSSASTTKSCAARSRVRR